MIVNQEDQVMTVKEVSEYLRLAESTVYKLASEGKLPGRKVGGTWRFSRKGLEDWLARPGSDRAGTSPSVREVSSESPV